MLNIVSDSRVALDMATNCIGSRLVIQEFSESRNTSPRLVKTDLLGIDVATEGSWMASTEHFNCEENGKPENKRRSDKKIAGEKG